MFSATIYAWLLASLAMPILGAVHERLGTVPRSWELVNTASEDLTIALSIALVRQNLDQLESKLAAVSTPGEPTYGQYLDRGQVEAEFPTVSSQPVVNWLKSNDVTEIYQDGSELNFATTVGNVNKLLNTTFAYYQKGNTQKLRTMQYSIPDDLTSYIDLISPTVFFGNTKAAAPIPSRREERDQQQKGQHNPTKTTVAASCQTYITPSCLKEMYNIGAYQPDPSSGSRIAFGSFLNESAQYVDMFTYEQFYGIPAQNFTVELINNGTNSQDAVTAQYGEANLDVQNIVGVSHPLPVHEFITGGSPPYIPNLDGPTQADNQNEPYLNYYEYLLSKTNAELPLVITNSYGDDEMTVPEYYAKRVCNLICLMGLRGISILESSGDEGIGSACMTNDGTDRQTFGPIFPATCPFLTSVGGTQAATPEIAWVGSSGGFSNYFKQAWYQKTAIDDYLKHHISEETIEYYSQYANFSGRGFPDVSAHSVSPYYEVIYAGTPSLSGGTSAASPVFASVIALLNDVRLRAGKPALGFLNPFLYSKGFKALNDITAGQSDGCNGYDTQSGQEVPGVIPIPWAHWNATAGWDPVTGLGTPDFEALKKLVLLF